MIFVAPSHSISSCAHFGTYSRSISIGTNAGARRPFALAEPINKLIIAPNNMIKDNNIESGKFGLKKNTIDCREKRLV